ncbi:hypothetical protein [Emticicia agri]|nr:hypothetical protein [Emticicia agri]
MNQEIIIKGGYFFGECFGTCQATVEIIGTTVKYTGKDNSKNNAEKQCSAKVSARVISDLEAAIDFDEFGKLPMVIGCPDCADGGAQWIEIVKSGESHKVVFDYNRPPDAIKELANFFSAQFTNFKNCR